MNYRILKAGINDAEEILNIQKLAYTIYERNKYECGDIEIFYMEKIKTSNK